MELDVVLSIINLWNRIYYKREVPTIHCHVKFNPRIIRSWDQTQGEVD